MIEVLWHGRGGQGAFTAARLLGAAASLGAGKYALAFPSFGPERRGAPIRAFTKMDAKKIGDHSEIAQADFVVYLDETLFGPGWEKELKDGGRVLVNSTRTFDDPRVMSLDANGMSLRLLGREIPNTTFLAALSVLAESLTPDDAREAVHLYMAPKLHASNIAIIDEVVELLANGEEPQDRQQADDEGIAAAEVGADASAATAAEAERADGERGGSSPDEPTDGLSADVAQVRVARPESVISRLRDDELDPFVFARTTTWEAGHLVTKNAGWRVYRPDLDAAKCTGCLQCYMQCPDGTIYKVRDTQADAAPVAIDYDFCKGCGMCVKACKFGALEMVPEGMVR